MSPSNKQFHIIEIDGVKFEHSFYSYIYTHKYTFKILLEGEK